MRSPERVEESRAHFRRKRDNSYVEFIVKDEYTEAKRQFSWKTLVEISACLYNQLGVQMKDQKTIATQGEIGLFPAIAKQLSSIKATWYTAGGG